MPIHAGNVLNFEFATAGRIVFGAGALEQAAPAAAERGRRVFLITGSRPQRAERLRQQLEQRQLSCTSYCVTGEPTIETAADAVRQARRFESDVVIGLGGGSVLDTGKVVAALLTNTGDLMEYLEVVGQGRPLQRPPADYIAIATTAGTGAEVTSNAVLGVPDQRVKVSMRHPWMLPRLAVVDPELTLSAPPAVTAHAGMDALTQLIESFVSCRANPLTDGICREGLRLAARSLLKAYVHGADHVARQDMSLASLAGGLALSNAKLGAVHGFAGPLGGMLAAGHGALCARLLPFVMAANIRALRQRAADAPGLGRFAELAQILTGKTATAPEEGTAWIEQLCRDLSVAPLRTFGLRPEDFSAAVAKAQKAGSMKGNPIALQQDELTEILQLAL
ncbi:MAG: iron-containing alcohol dehydrogenase [Sedimentisphaerales bacterium]|nr:iron-containing alcohol dehydrogenase [Sedimentisphaerales bacterium]